MEFCFNTQGRSMGSVEYRVLNAKVFLGTAYVFQITRISEGDAIGSQLKAGLYIKSIHSNQLKIDHQRLGKWLSI